jgi:hypothetical protein
MATECGNFMGFQVALLVCASTSEEVNSKFVELFGKHPILYDWKDPGYSRKRKI